MARSAGSSVLLFGIIYAINGILRRARRADPRAVALEARVSRAVAQIQPWTETVLKALAIKEIVGVLDSTIRDLISILLQNAHQ